MGDRIEVADVGRRIIGPSFPSERGPWAQPARDNRHYFGHAVDRAGELAMAASAGRVWQREQRILALAPLGRKRRVQRARGDAERTGRTRTICRQTDTTIVEAQHCAAGRALRIKKPPAARAAASRSKSMPAVTAMVGLRSGVLLDAAGRTTPKKSRCTCAWSSTKSMPRFVTEAVTPIPSPNKSHKSERRPSSHTNTIANNPSA